MLPASPGIRNGSGAVGVGVTAGAIHPHNGERVTIVKHAVEVAGGSGLGNVHAVVAHDGTQNGKAEDDKDELHL